MSLNVTCFFPFTGTMEERGFHTRKSDVLERDGKQKYTLSESETYDLPGVNRIARSFPCIRFLPFIQRQEKRSDEIDLNTDSNA